MRNWFVILSAVLSVACTQTRSINAASEGKFYRGLSLNKYKVAAIHPSTSLYTLTGINEFFSGLGYRVVDLKETYQTDYGYFLTVTCTNMGDSFEGSISMYAETVECSVTDRHSRNLIYKGVGKYSYLVKSVKNFHMATLAALNRFSIDNLKVSQAEEVSIKKQEPAETALQPAQYASIRHQTIETKPAPAAHVLDAKAGNSPLQPAHVLTEKRTALLIGNSDYRFVMPLDNPKHDAADLAEKLKGLGFSTTLLVNASQEEMENAVRNFGRRLIKNGGIGLFYYAGHGVQMNGQNYLIPANAHVVAQKDVKYKAVHLGMVMEEMGEARNGLNIIILDACRDNPLPASGRGFSQGLAQVNGPRGSFIAFATAPGETAQDGEGRNGTYTKHLLEQIDSKGLSLEKVFKNVAKGVVEETNNKQVPWVNSSFIGDFYFTR